MLYPPFYDRLRLLQPLRPPKLHVRYAFAWLRQAKPYIMIIVVIGMAVGIIVSVTGHTGVAQQIRANEELRVYMAV